MQNQTARQIPPAITNRESIHDLRNLFGVVASAGHMLEDALPAERRTLLLDAIEDAALRGGRLTTDLLMQGDPARTTDVVDVTHHLAALNPLICALAGRHVEVRMGLCVERLPVRLDPAGLDAAILELVANARAALLSPGTILIRAKRIGTRALLIVADTGRGMSEAELARALRGCDAPSATGTGLGRVRGFAWSARARLRIRSREGRGTVVSLNLPLVLKLASVEPAVPPVRRNHSAEETGHEKRQPVTA